MAPAESAYKKVVPRLCDSFVAVKFKTFMASKVALAWTKKLSPVSKSVTVSAPRSILKISDPIEPVRISFPPYP